ncbi:MAG: nitroreductase family deazaflavin-dependent oxidoreductase [Gaiella sp.]
MPQILLVAVALVVLAIVFLGLVFMLGMRAKTPWVLDLVRALNRRVINPRQMRSAGTPGAYASVIRHVGRRSGTAYETPIVCYPTADGFGFVVALPYGTRSSWVRNVLAAGSATLVTEGEVVDVDRPALVPLSDALEAIPEKEHGSLRRFRVEQAIELHRAAASAEGLDTRATT